MLLLVCGLAHRRDDLHLTKFTIHLENPKMIYRRGAGVVDSMIKNESRTILVVNDVEATRDGIKIMLERDGYCIKTARNEQDAAEKRFLKGIDLMLVSLEGEKANVIAAAERIRACAGLDEDTPIIIFCVVDFKDDESAVEANVYLCCPDDFNRLRDFIKRLLNPFSSQAKSSQP